MMFLFYGNNSTARNGTSLAIETSIWSPHRRIFHHHQAATMARYLSMKPRSRSVPRFEFQMTNGTAGIYSNSSNCMLVVWFRVSWIDIWRWTLTCFSLNQHALSVTANVSMHLGTNIILLISPTCSDCIQVSFGSMQRNPACAIIWCLKMTSFRLCSKWWKTTINTLISKNPSGNCLWIMWIPFNDHYRERRNMNCISITFCTIIRNMYKFAIYTGETFEILTKWWIVSPIFQRLITLPTIGIVAIPRHKLCFWTWKSDQLTK